MNEFSNLTLSPVLQGNLAKNAFVTPTPVQAQAIPPALAGKDVVATAQTGTGKTLAFSIPMIERMLQTLDKPGTGKIRAVVLSPTRELAIQINETVLKLIAGTQLRSAVVVGGMDETRQLRQIRNGAQIVIATPGRLCDFLERRLVDLRGVNTMVLDEADRMLDMGFLPSIKQILQDLPETRQTMLFSATIEKSVAHLVASYVKNPARISIGVTTKPAEHVDLHVYEIDQERKLELLTRLLRDEPGAFLVFARTKHGADRLAKHLGRFGHDAARIHGDRTQGQRNQALQGFKDGRFRVLVATDVAARGIHVDNIAHVVNYDLPQVPEDFIHRAGRTGRAGSRGVASTFHTRHERGDIRQIERALQVQMNRRVVPAGAAPEAKYAHVDDVPDIEKIAAAPPVKAVKSWDREKPRFKGSAGSFSGRGKGGFQKPFEAERPTVAATPKSFEARDGFQSRPTAGFEKSGFEKSGFVKTGFVKAGSAAPAFGKSKPFAASASTGFKSKSVAGFKPREAGPGSVNSGSGFRPASAAGFGGAKQGVGFKSAGGFSKPAFGFKAREGGAAVESKTGFIVKPAKSGSFKAAGGSKSGSSVGGLKSASGFKSGGGFRKSGPSSTAGKFGPSSSRRKFAGR